MRRLKAIPAIAAQLSHRHELVREAAAAVVAALCASEDGGEALLDSGAVPHVIAALHDSGEPARPALCRTLA